MGLTVPIGYARASFFDASALVKLYVEEPRSDALREYFHAEPTKYTTTFCFYEALNILKSAWRYQGRLTHEDYLEACFRLTAWYEHTARWIANPQFTEPTTLSEARELARTHALDMSDALQLITVKHGYFSSFAEGSQTVFVTADKPLAAVARQVGLRVWSVMEEDPPT
jgi:predicted nucleic acid-binding protein